MRFAKIPKIEQYNEGYFAVVWNICVIGWVYLYIIEYTLNDNQRDVCE